MHSCAPVVATRGHFIRFAQNCSGSAVNTDVDRGREGASIGNLDPALFFFSLKKSPPLPRPLLFLYTFFSSFHLLHPRVSPRGGDVMLKMARVLHNLLSFLSGLARHLRVVGYWSLVYGCCCVCAAAALLKLWWSVVLRPSATFRWASRDIPPACLNDTSLGTHCYVRIKVGRASMRRRAQHLGVFVS